MCRNVDPLWIAEGRLWRLQLVDQDGVVGAHSTRGDPWELNEVEFELTMVLSHCRDFEHLWDTLAVGDKAIAVAYRAGIFWDDKTKHWVQGI